jgi:hypothetical protein
MKWALDKAPFGVWRLAFGVWHMAAAGASPSEERIPHLTRLVHSAKSPPYMHFLHRSLPFTTARRARP